MLCGSLASQHLGEIAIFCTELMVQKGHDVKVRHLFAPDHLTNAPLTVRDDLLTVRWK
jgi:hypothetical protein